MRKTAQQSFLFILLESAMEGIMVGIGVWILYGLIRFAVKG